MSDTVAADPARMHTWATRLRGGGGDLLDGVVTSLRGVQCPTEDVFGSPAAAAAYTQFSEAWIAEVDTVAGAIDQTAGADLTADSRAAVDETAAQGMTTLPPR